MPDAEKRSLSFQYYDVITAVFVAVLLITQTTAQKIFSVGPASFSAGILLFPVSYIFGDILTEVYGYRRSRRVIWLGFASSGLMSIIYLVVGLLPPAPDWQNQEAYMAILGVVPRIAVGSLVAYWAGEFLNSYVLAKMKIWTKGKYLWTRTIASTIVGEGVDTAIVMFIAFYGVLPMPLLLSVMFNIYWVKVLYEILATPLTYLAVNFLKRREGVDVYDTDTKFNPFRFNAER